MFSEYRKQTLIGRKLKIIVTAWWVKYHNFPKMLRKKEKKAIASIFMLLIGWPVGLDQFFEGNNEKGISITIGWTISFFFLFYGLRLNGNNAGSSLIIAVILILLGGLQSCKRLIKLSRAFVNAKDCNVKLKKLDK